MIRILCAWRCLLFVVDDETRLSHRAIVCVVVSSSIIKFIFIPELIARAYCSTFILQYLYCFRLHILSTSLLISIFIDIKISVFRDHTISKPKSWQLAQ